MTTHRLGKTPKTAYQGLLLGWLGVATALGACSSKPVVSHDDEGAGDAGTAVTAGTAGTAAATAGRSSGIIVGAGGNNGAAGTDCGETAQAATVRPVNVLVLLDRSLSMTTAISTTDTTSRWGALRSALNTSMTSVSDRVYFGLKLFPDGGASSECGVLGTAPEVTLGLGSSTVTGIDQAIAQAVPNGGTPIAAALDWARTYYVTGPGSQAIGDRVILLATDGAPNCNASTTCDAASCITNIDNPTYSGNLCSGYPTECLDGANAQAKVESLLALPTPVRTVVVGIPGSDKPAYATILDNLGRVGGLPNPDPKLDYFAVSATEGAIGLSDTLKQITTQLIVSCRLDLDSTPPDSTLLNVYVDGAVIPKDAANGWKLDASTNPPSVVLEGTTCRKLETSGAQSISIKYGCPTYVLL